MPRKSLLIYAHGKSSILCVRVEFVSEEIHTWDASMTLTNCACCVRSNATGTVKALVPWLILSEFDVFYEFAS
jgi:hypothetical protein